MTNAPPEMNVFADALICRPSLGQWLATAGWPVLLLGIIVLVVNLLRQSAVFRRPSGQIVSERLSAVGITTGWFSFMVGTGMAWYGLHCSWSIGAMSDTVDQGLLLLSYAQSSFPGFIGLLILSGSFFEAALFKYLWMRKIKTEHNQVPEDSARKLAGTQR